MGIYQYTIKNNTGSIVKGKIEAESSDKALQYLSAQNAIILSLQETKEKAKTRKISRGKVKTDELVIFSRQLTTLIASGIPVVNALDILSQQVKTPYFRQVVGAISQDLKQGSSFAGALGKFTNIFSELYVSMVEAAETAGNLPEILERLSLYLERTSALRKKIISSMTYPAIVVAMAVAITAFLIFKVIPTFKGIFAMLGGALPLPTQILIAFSEIMKKGIVYIIIGFIMFIFVVRWYISTPSGKMQYHRLLLNLPIVGDIIRKISIAKFARTFSTLVKSGVPIVTSLSIVGKTAGNKIVENAVTQCKKAVQEGVPLSKPLEESGVFPPMVIKMIAVGENTGKLEHMLTKISEFYEEQTEIVIGSLTSLIEPLIIAFLGIVIGGIVVALFLPIIQVTRLIGG